MNFEKYSKIYEDYIEGTNLRVGGGGKKFRFSFKPARDTKYRLFATGETGLFYQWKNEPDNPIQYRTVTDALDRENADKAAYALNLSSKKPELYIRRVYKKLLWTPKLAYINMNPTPEAWDIGFFAKTKALKINEGGYLRMRVDVRFKKDGVSAESVILPPDESYVIDLCDTDGAWKKYSLSATLQKDKVASLGVFFEGVGYTGNVFIERPFITSPEIPEKNVLPDFSVPVTNKDYYDWTAQYLSRKEWPEFRIKLNGTLIFEGEIFDRCHRGSEWSVNVPKDSLAEENELEIELISDYHEPLPYNLFELGIIATPGGSFALLSASESAAVGGKAYALIRTEKDNTVLTASYSHSISGEKEFCFKEAGLHGISFDALEISENAEFTLTDGEKSESGKIGRIVFKEDDRIYTGTGDMVYVKQDEDDVEEFLSWYVAEGIGNMLTVRPTYRWSGTRTLNENCIKNLARVLNELGMKYPLMLDGRELPGINANPDDKMLEGEGFLGRQMHERDGAMFYWRRYKAASSDSAKQHRDLIAEAYREDPEHTNPQYSPEHTIIYNVNTAKKALDTTPTFDGDELLADACYQHRNPTLKKDMEFAYHEVIDRINTERCGMARHTGPSTLFKYMLDGGYSWVGAETMYGTMEPLMSFLRGATLDRGIDTLGVHHALQWSSSPEEAPEHVRRYRLALYVSYMQGANEINSEEGLWHLEEYYSHFNRFNTACIEHTKQQQDFYRYVKTHTRRGKFYTPIGLIHGKYDGWHGFGRNALWGWKNVTDTDAEKSWDLLSVFYPEGNLGDSLYCHGFPTDKPLGFYSSTPIGNVDAIPVEDRSCRFSEYKTLIFMGYNKCEKEDASKLYNYILNGGKLLLTLAHLTKTTDYKSVLNGDLEYEECQLSFTNSTPVLEEKKVMGQSVKVAVNIRPADEILAYTDDGTPLVLKYKLGNGEYTVFAASAYPANEAIKDLYEAEMKKHAQNAVKEEKIFAEGDAGVEFSVYERDGERDIYFLAVDWYNSPEKIRTARLLLGDKKHTVSLPFGVMIKAVANEKSAAFPHSEDAEVISVKDGYAVIQGTGRVKFTFINEAESREEIVDFSHEKLQKIKL